MNTKLTPLVIANMAEERGHVEFADYLRREYAAEQESMRKWETPGGTLRHGQVYDVTYTQGRGVLDNYRKVNRTLRGWTCLGTPMWSASGSYLVFRKEGSYSTTTVEKAAITAVTEVNA